jgi:hypothetical protein
MSTPRSGRCPPALQLGQQDFRTIQSVSDLNSGLLASHLDIVALRIASKSEQKSYKQISVEERTSDEWRF